MPAVLLAAGLLTAGLLACSPMPIQAVLPPALIEAPAWPVSGRHGWRPDSRPLRFGGYSTSARTVQQQLERMPCTPNCQAHALGGVLLTLRGREESARRTLQFTQFGPDAPALSVLAVAATWQEEQQWRVQAFGRSVSGSEGTRIVQPLIGTLDPPAGQGAGWRFVVSGKPGAEPAGWAHSDGGQRIELRTLAARMAGVPGTSAPALAGMWLPAGYTLLSGEQTLAAVRLIGEGDGEVWMSPTASPELRQAAAALVSVLLLGPSAPALR